MKSQLEVTCFQVTIQMTTNVFDASAGRLIVLDIQYIASSVAVLKEAIQLETNIPVDQQALVASGGKVLRNNDRIADYGSGTVENPVFLFHLGLFSSQAISKELSFYSVDIPQVSSKEHLAVSQMESSFECLEAGYYLAERLSTEIWNISKDVKRLIYDQRTEFQAWLAVVANLEDMCICCLEINQRMCSMLNNLRGNDDLIAGIDSLHAAIEELDRIPITEISSWSLIDSAECEGIDNSNVNKSLVEVNHGNSLLSWIENELKSIGIGSVDEYINESRRIFKAVDRSEIMRFFHSTEKIIAEYRSSDNREVIGIEEVFQHVDDISSDLECSCQNASASVEAMACTRKRFKSEQPLMNERALLKEICRCHHSKILCTLMSNRGKAVKHRSSALRSKQELLSNIHERLSWITFAQKHVNELDGRTRIYINVLTSVSERIELIQQLLMTKHVFEMIRREACRRKEFNTGYSKLQSGALLKLQSWMTMEATNRKRFIDSHGEHFLTRLAPDLLVSNIDHFTFTHDDSEVTSLSSYQDDTMMTADDLNCISTSIVNESCACSCRDLSQTSTHLKTLNFAVGDNPQKKDDVTCCVETSVQTSYTGQTTNVSRLNRSTSCDELVILETLVEDVQMLSSRSAKEDERTSTGFDGSDLRDNRNMLESHESHVARNTRTDMNLGSADQNSLSVEIIEVGSVVAIARKPLSNAFEICSRRTQFQYFVHPESFRNLGLDDTNDHTFRFAKITHLTFCQIQKDDNRFILPRGAKFWLAKCTNLD